MYIPTIHIRREELKNMYIQCVHVYSSGSNNTHGQNSRSNDNDGRNSNSNKKGTMSMSIVMAMATATTYYYHHESCYMVVPIMTNELIAICYDHHCYCNC